MSVSQFISLSVTRLRYTNMAERIEVLFRVETLGDMMNIRRCPDFPLEFDPAFAKLLWPLVITSVREVTTARKVKTRMIRAFD